MKIIIDCDVGIDDAYAIMLASLLDDVEILAITVVHGNSIADNCLANTKLLLDKLYKERPQPRIYLGASRPLLHNHVSDEPYFGSDGLAGFTQTLYAEEIKGIREVHLERIKRSEHAAVKIVELVNEHPNEVTILCLGPLTNLALALSLSRDSDDFCKKIKRLVIMGGNEPSEDNEAKFIESNFVIDPVAAKVTIEEYTCPKTLCTFQMTVRSFHKSIDMHKIKEMFEKRSEVSSRCRFMQSIGIVFNKEEKIIDYISCDFITMLIALRNDECKTVYKKFKSCNIDVTDRKGLLKVNNESEKEDLKRQDILVAEEISLEIAKKYIVFCIERMTELDQGIKR